MKRIAFFLPALLAFPMIGNLPAADFQSLEKPRPSPAAREAARRVEDLLVLDNGTVRVGVNRAMGGTITWLSWTGHPGNTINSHDPGRLLQQSYYAGRSLDRTAEGQSKAWSPWPWNPIQGGGVGSWARVVTAERAPGETLFTETIPKLWDMPDEEAAAVMRQWTGFAPGMPDVVVVRCEFVSRRTAGDRWGPARPAHQEIPACYFTRTFDRIRSYLGNGAWRDETQPPGPPWGRTEPPRKAMACFTADGRGIAVFSPAATRAWNFGPHGRGASADPAAGPCIHIAPIDRVPLGPQSTYRHRYWLVVGDAARIAERLDTLWNNHADERAVLTEP